MYGDGSKETVNALKVGTRDAVFGRTVDAVDRIRDISEAETSTARCSQPSGEVRYGYGWEWDFYKTCSKQRSV